MSSMFVHVSRFILYENRDCPMQGERLIAEITTEEAMEQPAIVSLRLEAPYGGAWTVGHSHYTHDGVTYGLIKAIAEERVTGSAADREMGWLLARIMDVDDALAAKLASRPSSLGWLRRKLPRLPEVPPDV